MSNFNLTKKTAGTLSRLLHQSNPQQKRTEHVEMQTQLQESENCQQPNQVTMKEITKGKATSLQKLGDGVPSIFKTTSSLNNLNHHRQDQRKVNFDLDNNQQIVVENWKQINRINTYQLGEEKRDCCSLI